MTTYYDFTPTSQAPYQFQPILNGVSYFAIVKWNLFGQRWYVYLYDNSGARVFTKALIGSPTGILIQSMAWDLSGTVTIQTITPHGYDIGSTINLTVSGATPVAYNGQMTALITSPNELTFKMSVNPGQAQIMGAVSYDIDLLWGYGFSSTMVFRQSAQQFEISP